MSCSGNGIFTVAMSNPIFVQNLHSPDGSFKLQFYTYIPSSYVENVCCESKLECGVDDVIFIHLASRIPEGCDINQISLFERKQLDSIKCLPSIYLGINLSNKSVSFIVCASSGMSSKTSRDRYFSTPKIFENISSRTVRTDTWLKCSINLVSLTSNEGMRESSHNDSHFDRDTYRIDLLVNGECHSTTEGIFRGY